MTPDDKGTPHMLKALTLALTLHAAHAAPVKHDSKAVAAAKADVAKAKAHLHDVQKTERATRGAAKRAKRARAKAAAARIMSLPDDAPELGADLGCGTCQDNHDGSCTCPPSDEDTCRAIATSTGETWEDACDRIGLRGAP